MKWMIVLIASTLALSGCAGSQAQHDALVKAYDSQQSYQKNMTAGVELLIQSWVKDKQDQVDAQYADAIASITKADGTASVAGVQGYQVNRAEKLLAVANTAASMRARFATIGADSSNAGQILLALQNYGNQGVDTAAAINQGADLLYGVLTRLIQKPKVKP